MPSLGFLKKKRTRDDKTDPSSSQPASPVTPTVSQNFESQLSQSPAQNTTGGTVSHTRTTSSQNRPATGEAPNPTSAGGGHQMNVVQSHQHLQQPPFGIQPSPSPGQVGTPQHLPSINNLINLPQNDGMALNTQNLTSGLLITA